MEEDVRRGRTRVLVVDDHRIVRDWVRATLPEDEFVVTGEAATANDGIRAAERQRPDVVVLDLGLPDRSGTTVCAAVRDALPDTSIVILSSYGDDASVHAAISAGADAYLLKDAEDLDLVDTVRKVRAGESVIDPRAAASLFRDIRSPKWDDEPRLTEQEVNIVQLVAQGLTNPEIGARLFLSRHTVKEYLSRAMRKLGVSTRVEAVLEATRRGLLEPQGGGGAVLARRRAGKPTV
jgi:two-component system, NarL family, response regulator DevR